MSIAASLAATFTTLLLITTGTPSMAEPQMHRHSNDTAASYHRAREATLDAYLTGRLITAYALSEPLANSDIHVLVRHRKAILSGLVSSPVERELAVEIARGIEGLDEVEDSLELLRDDQSTIRSSAPQQQFAEHFRDAATKARVKTRLLWSEHISGLRIEVQCSQGQILMQGEVDDAAQAALAEAIARATEGVQSVDNQLQLASAGRSH